MSRQSQLSAEQIAKIEEMLKTGVKVPEIAIATGAKDYQINVIKRRLGLVQKRNRTAKVGRAAIKVTAKTASRKSVGGSLTVSEIRGKLEAAQKTVTYWQEKLLARVVEIEKMIATIKGS